MNDAPKLAKAQLIPLPDGVPMDVHFNPASLVYTVENKGPQTSGSPKARQFVAQFSGKLTMDLQFDTTDTGVDVRQLTGKVARFMEPSAKASHAADEANNAASKQKNPPQPAHAPAVLRFKWGSYEFMGIMESFKETIDFFSAEGVALRALVSIGLARQDLVFDDKANLSPAVTSGSLVPTSAGADPQKLSSMAGDSRATRQLASDNGLESMRFTGGMPLQVNSSPQLNPPAGFASASASAQAVAGASSGIGVGVGAGVNLGGGRIGMAGASAGADITGGTSLTISGSAGVSGAGAVFGAKTSAGVSAIAGAFAGLQFGRATRSTTAQLDPLKMMPATIAADVSTGTGASFSLGGSAMASASAGLSADVGAKFQFSDRLKFTDD